MDNDDETNNISGNETTYLLAQQYHNNNGGDKKNRQHRRRRRKRGSTMMKVVWQNDYITMEPWIDYYPKIIKLRQNHQHNILFHLNALSSLSSKILLSIIVLLFGFGLFSLLCPVKYSSWELIVVRIIFKDY